MYDGFLSNLHPATKLIFSLLMIVITFIAFFLGGLFFAMLIYNISLSDLQSITKDVENLSLLRYLQVLQAFSLFIIPSLILAFLFKRNGFKYLCLDKKPKGVSLLIVGLLIFVSLPFINFLAELNSKLNLPEFLSGIEQWMKSSEKEALVLTEKFLKVDTIGGLLFNIFMIALLPALGEEFIFRGIFQRLFSEWTKNIHIGIFISAFLFSAFHLQFYGFLPRLILGMMFGYLLFWSKSIWLPIIAHFINNAMAVIMYYFITKGTINQEIDKIGSKNDTLIFTIVSFILISGLLYLLYNKENGLKLNNTLK